MTLIKSTLPLVAAMLVTVATIALSALALRAPTQTQSPVTLKGIQTDRAAIFYVDRSPDCAWFREGVLPTGDSNVMTENLKSVVATL